VPYPAYPGAESGAGAHLPSVMTESPFASSGRYPLDRCVPTSWTSVTRSSSLLRAHAPDLDSLFHSAIGSDPQSLQVAVSPCCIQVLPGVISANLSSDPWTPTTVADKVLLPVSSPGHVGLPQIPNGSAAPHISVQRLLNGGCFRGCSHSIIFRPPSLLPPRSFPPLASTAGARAAVAFTSKHSAVCYLPAHRIC
jgi:hypothetical protein